MAINRLPGALGAGAGAGLGGLQQLLQNPMVAQNPEFLKMALAQAGKGIEAEMSSDKQLLAVSDTRLQNDRQQLDAYNKGIYGKGTTQNG